MGSILQREEMDQIAAIAAEKVYNLQSEIVFFPVRHHSPACSYHLQQTIAAYKPDIILIEGPSGSNALIDILSDGLTEPPVSIYYARMGQEDMTACYYPLLAYSPEYVALREARRRGIPARFIDLDYRSRSVTRQTVEGESPAANDERTDQNEQDESAGPDKISLLDESMLFRSEYIARLCAKTGSRSFDELWENVFEIGGLRKPTAAFVSEVFTYCTLARKGYSEEELAASGDLLREAHMRREIAAAADKHGKLLVVTGGFHTWGLLDGLETVSDSPMLAGEASETACRMQVTNCNKPMLAGHAPKTSLGNTNAVDEGQSQAAAGQTGQIERTEQTKQTEQVFPMVYSFEEADRLNGYASGMPYVNYYDAVWQALQRGDADPYIGVMSQFLAQLLQRLRRRSEPVSTADAIEAHSLAQGLALLRGKDAPGVYELIDGVQSAFTKGESSVATAAPLEMLHKLLTGDKIGTVARNSLEAPIVRDFKETCRIYRLSIGGTGRSSRQLQLYAKERHRKTSQFLHCAEFLDTGFCKRTSGPDWINRRDVNLLRESWDYGYSSLVEARLIENSIYGGTVAQAAIRKMEERIAALPDQQSEQAAKLLLQALLMGLEQLGERLYALVESFLSRDGSFVSLCGTLQILLLLQEQRTLLGIADGNRLSGLTRAAYGNAAGKLHTLARPNPQELGEIADRLKLLYMLSLQVESEEMAAGIFREQLQELLADAGLPALLEGVVAAILVNLGSLEPNELARRARAYIHGSEAQMLCTAQYLQGVFTVKRDIFLHDDRLLGELDTLLEQLSHEQFVQLVPELRLAFTYFTPVEISKIAERAAALSGLAPQHYGRPAVDEALLLRTRALDEAIKEEFRQWSLI
ncbi:hypothetical protein EBB07_02195 [Paenibacillaceae bacterium]|nr:hypothetical protein EBB07_02195 [Paenibacillaceae bacterium]